MYKCVWYFCIYLYGLSLNGWYALFHITNNRLGVTITTHATKRHFLIWMTTMRQPTKRRCSCVLSLKYTFICVCWWTRQRIHNTLIVVDRYLRLMGDKIPHSSQVSIYHNQGVVDSYSLVHPRVQDKCRVSEIDLSQPRHEWRHNGSVTS